VSAFSRRDFLKTSGALIVGFSGLASGSGILRKALPNSRVASIRLG
jgi:hypothetical protein